MTANTVNGAHLLLVEDEPVASKMLSRILDLEGFRVTTAPDGVSALELMAEGPPDALITDLKMPRGSGSELVRQARAKHANLPIVVVTGFFYRRDGARARRARRLHRPSEAGGATRSHRRP